MKKTCMCEKRKYGNKKSGRVFTEYLCEKHGNKRMIRIEDKIPHGGGGIFSKLDK